MIVSLAVTGVLLVGWRSAKAALTKTVSNKQGCMQLCPDQWFSNFPG